MATSGFQVSGGASLDDFLDFALNNDPEAADWSQAALSLSTSELQSDENTAFSSNQRDPFLRLFDSNIGKWALAKFQNESRSLGEVGLLAVHLIDENVIDDAINMVMGRPPSAGARRLVVFHGQAGARRSLLILDPELKPHAAATVVPSWLLARGVEKPSNEAYRYIEQLHPELARDFSLIAQAALVARPRVVVAPAPQMDFTCVPDPRWKVMQGTEVSTVGALVLNAAGERGVTVCHHGTGPMGTPISLIDGTESVETTITAASAVMDVCFAPVGDNWRPPAMIAQAGVLEKRAPGAAENHRFFGFGSGIPKNTRVVGLDMGIPFPSQGRQLCVHTTADTNYGDSGTALINDDDKLVGFAFQRTPYAAPGPVEFASWIWARSALEELDLTI